MNYEEFLTKKSQIGSGSGFKPLFLPSCLKDFQAHLTDWSIRNAKSALFEDCGLGKSVQELVWGENVVRHTNKPVILLTPLAVTAQMVREGAKFDIEIGKSRDGTVHPNITTTNYQQLHKYNPEDFGGAICDESSSIKTFGGATQKSVTEFLSKIPFRLLATATAAPNDFIELGTSSEALGQLGRMDMLSHFFKNDENSLHPVWWGARWRLKGHAQRAFWQWVCSWARACRKPSDLGFDDKEFILPPLNVREFVIENSEPLPGELFKMLARTLPEQREERRTTIKKRCEKVVELCEPHPLSVIWCHYNEEGDLLEKIVPGAVQVSGKDSDEEKEEKFEAFSNGEIKRLITKQKIGGWGLNWQHCRHTVQFPSHSFEAYYQSVRRFWRFGQTQPVTCDIVTTEGEQGVLKNMQRKSEQADEMFSKLIAEMYSEIKMNRRSVLPEIKNVPAWVA